MIEVRSKMNLEFSLPIPDGCTVSNPWESILITGAYNYALYRGCQRMGTYVHKPDDTWWYHNYSGGMASAPYYQVHVLKDLFV